jgi:transcriptional repressor NrdR
MRCPFCNFENTRVIDSRPAEENNSIRRRRVCEECGKRFTTYEKIETLPVMIVKKDRSREAYNRSKIEMGIMKACHKRPISTAEMTEAINSVENNIFSLEKSEVESSYVGELIMEKLKALDPVAYVRFASVYREFKDADTFMEELKSVLNL